ncbi:hypothetical protein PR048_018350 [Dryococelus australis]|uniref:Uncharacterized protein n=1 Tax=Dryococelus australis TaxID=614101 RepID=A0ABQ9HC68_9NEOP|nr:hypothetical protein PR048_018350 [Dryococelus australis]
MSRKPSAPRQTGHEAQEQFVSELSWRRGEHGGLALQADDGTRWTSRWGFGRRSRISNQPSASENVMPFQQSTEGQSSSEESAFYTGVQNHPSVIVVRTVCSTPCSSANGLVFWELLPTMYFLHSPISAHNVLEYSKLPHAQYASFVGFTPSRPFTPRTPHLPSSRNLLFFIELDLSRAHSARWPPSKTASHWIAAGCGAGVSRQNILASSPNPSEPPAGERGRDPSKAPSSATARPLLSIIHGFPGKVVQEATSVSAQGRNERVRERQRQRERELCFLDDRSVEVVHGDGKSELGDVFVPRACDRCVVQSHSSSGLRLTRIEGQAALLKPSYPHVVWMSSPSFVLELPLCHPACFPCPSGGVGGGIFFRARGQSDSERARGLAVTRECRDSHIPTRQCPTTFRQKSPDPLQSKADIAHILACMFDRYVIYVCGMVLYLSHSAANTDELQARVEAVCNATLHVHIHALFDLMPLRVRAPITTLGGFTTYVWSSAGMKGRGKREMPEKTRRPVASSGKIPTCENPGMTRPGIELGSRWWKAIELTGRPPSLFRNVGTDISTIMSLHCSETTIVWLQAPRLRECKTKIPSLHVRQFLSANHTGWPLCQRAGMTTARQEMHLRRDVDEGGEGVVAGPGHICVQHAQESRHPPPPPPFSSVGTRPLQSQRSHLYRRQIARCLAPDSNLCTGRSWPRCNQTKIPALRNLSVVLKTCKLEQSARSDRLDWERTCRQKLKSMFSHGGPRTITSDRKIS